MAPKRQKKGNIGVENINKYDNILISDALCPICRSILIEPVTLPCNHGFCFTCFNGTMENNTLTCPLCRIRIGSWLRTARKENKIVNDTFWRVLQYKFPTEIQKKKQGEDEQTNDKISIRLADPGEIRMEYEIQLAKELSEIQKEKEAEENASRAVIEKILQEEKEKARLQEEKLRLDEEIAKRLAKELSNAGPSNIAAPKIIKKGSLDNYFMSIQKQKLDKTVNTQKNQSIHTLANKCHTTTILNQNRRSCSAAYKHLLLTKTLQREQNNSNGSDSGDSIKQEMRYFKPIRTVPKSVPKLLSDGNISIAPVIKVPAVLPKIKPIPIKKPNSLNLTTISTENSAFVNVKMPNCQIKPETQFRTDENGKIIKTYFNQKLNRLKNNSGSSSPVLGFEKTSNNSDILSAIVKSLSANLNGETNSVNISQVNKSVCNQEEADLEFARKLHEEINNPRNREYITRSQDKVNLKKGKSKKRQITLKELVAPKKFKI